VDVMTDRDTDDHGRQSIEKIFFRLDETTKNQRSAEVFLRLSRWSSELIPDCR